MQGMMGDSEQKADSLIQKEGKGPLGDISDPQIRVKEKICSF